MGAPAEGYPSGMSRCQFVPPYLVERVQPPALVARDRELRAAREAGPRPIPRSALAREAWVVHDCDNTADLPGRRVRASGEPESGDEAVDEAAYGAEGALELCRMFGRRSFDGEGAQVSASVHYEQGYANAFWDGTQLVFGDGDGEIFGRFTRPVDVLGHEFAHALVERTTGFTYWGQPGALNESFSDVYGACLKQWLLGQSADEADWLVGEGLFLPGVRARGLRDMATPGTAYDDPRLGRDPQVGHMADYIDTAEDNGGVHYNSGIPNRAFHLAATAIGGNVWEGAGRVWWQALTMGDLGAESDFAGFAAATILAAGEHEQAVARAWDAVGVTPMAGSADQPAHSAAGRDPEPSPIVFVRRTGGVAGIVSEGSVNLETRDERVPELRTLVERVDVAAVGERAPAPAPDRFVYDFDLCGASCQVGEQGLTDELRRIADLLLR